MGDFLTQAKACGYRSLSKESLNLGINQTNLILPLRNGNMEDRRKTACPPTLFV
jgi:hypothetical protein